jgi:lipopolysaccharide transport system permease protein
MIYYKFTPPFALLLLPVILFFTWMLAAGIGYFVSAINVKYRDVRYVVPFFLQLLIYITPVIYPLSIATNRFRWLFSLNPMAGFIETHRAIILGHQPINVTLLIYAIGITVIIFITGLIYFKSVERFFADII